MKAGQKVVDIMPDGTLVVYTRHYDAVKRVVIMQNEKEPMVFVREKPAKKEK